MSNQHEKEPTRKPAPRPIHEIPGGGDLPVMPNFSYQPGSTRTPDENTTSVEITFTPKPGKEGWTWTASAASFSTRTDGQTVIIDPSGQGFTRSTVLAKIMDAGYFGLYVSCTDGTSTESEGVLYSWADGSAQAGWVVALAASGTEMTESEVV